MQGCDGPNYQKLWKDIVLTYGVKYDYCSIMHSQVMRDNCIILPKTDKFKCRINGKTSTSAGQRLGLSSLDMLEINKRYKCTGMFSFL